MKKRIFAEKFEKANKKITPSFKEEIRKSNEQLGEKTKLVICMEEAAELSQAISKYYRNKPDRLNLIEEIGDMIICIESLKQICNITEEEIIKAINVKIDRGVS